jgi:hypothetical protein
MFIIIRTEKKLSIILNRREKALGRNTTRGMIENSYSIDDLHRALHFHLNTNMYPPLPQNVQDNITKLFHKFWTSSFSEERFVKVWERTVGKRDAIHKYSFDEFLTTERL